jgi:hypothetical protein
LAPRVARGWGEEQRAGPRGSAPWREPRQYTRRVPVLLAAVGMLVASLDSAVNVALRAMAQAFAIGPAEIRWVIICYVIRK